MFIIAGGVILGILGFFLVLALAIWIILGVGALLKVLITPLDQLSGIQRLIRYAFVVVILATGAFLYSVLHL